VALVASAAAAWISEHYGAPIILMGLLIGLAMSFVGTDERSQPGLDFASQTCLRWGIVILGTQITLVQIGALGIAPFVALLVVMAAAFGAALLAARLAGQSAAVGMLAGGATAICGASAALALYGVLGRERLSQAQFALTLVGISAASALAMSFYPLLAASAGMSDRQAGFLIGASIHDVAQAIGGGYAFSDGAGGYAAVVKLTRVALLAPLVMLVSLALPAAPAAGQAPRGRVRTMLGRLAVPWFILGFLALVLANSVLALPREVTENSLLLSKALLLLAVTATAMRSRTDLILRMGWKAAVPVVSATLASLVAALGFSLLLL
jgi:uncharacterized integral membrane protein (TIGR00698 family)